MRFLVTLVTILTLIVAISAVSCKTTDKNTPAYGTPKPTSQQLVAQLGLDTDSEEAYKKYGQTSGPYKLDELEVRKLNGRPVSLKGYQGHWILLDFFTTYAIPSQGNMPILNDLYNKYKDKGLIVVGVSMDLQGRLMVEPFIEELKIDYPVYLADGETKTGKTPYGFIREIPVILLINPKGGMEKGYMGLIKQEELESVIKKKL